MYKPLPESLTIKDSPIHGLGLFAKQDIVKGIELGITHVYDENFENNYIRTPLGGFINHSETPNCELFDLGRHYVVRTIKHIKRGEELTVKYRWYNPKGEEE